MTGKASINPRQIDGIHSVFAPTAEGDKTCRKSFRSYGRSRKKKEREYLH